MSDASATTGAPTETPMPPNAPQFRAVQQTAIAEFWTWWTTTGAEALDTMFTAMLDGVAPSAPIDIHAEVGGRLAAIHPQLIWGFEPGQPLSKHLLTVTAAGDPELRPVARRWLNAAPDDDATWAFTDLRQADRSMPIDWDMGADFGSDGKPMVAEADADSANSAGAAGAPTGQPNVQSIQPGDARVQVSEGNGFVDVRLYHPAFAELARKGEEGQRAVVQLGFTMMQLALGEEDFGLWLRNFAFSEVDPPESIPLPELGQRVGEVADNCPGWLSFDAEANGEPISVTTASPLVQLVNPLFTEHVIVQLLYTGVDEKNLPNEQSQAAIAEMNKKLIDALGADGMVVATEASDGVYLLHCYADTVSSADSEAGLYDVAGTSPAQRLEAVAAEWSEGQVEVLAMHDPAWGRIGHLRM